MNKKVFVYGTLKQGGSNHPLLYLATFLGTHITENKWTMIDFGPFPAILEGGSSPIHGEVYEINEEIETRLDLLEGYPHMYGKQKINTAYGEALVYFMNETIDDNYEVIENGEWVV